MNSIIQTYSFGARTVFREILLLHLKFRRWHYAIRLDNFHDSSLAHFLGLSNKDLFKLMELMGFASLKGNNTWTIDRVSIQNFINEFELHHHSVYFDNYNVKNSIAGIKNQSHRGLWIGIGVMDGYYKNDVVTPGSQFKSKWKGPPKISKKKKYITELKYFLHLYIAHQQAAKLQPSSQANNEKKKKKKKQT